MKKKLKKAPEQVPFIDLPEPAIAGLHLVIYKNCPRENEFILADGRHLANLFELAQEIGTMDPGAFAHHVNHQRDDFANWVEHVFGEKHLAGQFRLSLSQERHEIALLKHLLGKIIEHEKRQ